MTAELQKRSVKEKVLEFIAKYFLLFLLFGTIGYCNAPKLIDHLTPVDTLAERIHERSKHNFSGAKCNDGWTSHSQGQGTCSWHGGVDYYFNKGDYSKTIEECREEAIQLSWFAP